MRLVEPDLAVLDAALEGPDALSAALGGAAVADGWVVFDDALTALRDAVARDPASTRWGSRLFVLDEPHELVGWGGFKGPPAGGVVEVGYAVAPAHRGRGIAGNAVAQMLDEAFADPEVLAVTAHTLAEPNASTRVLEKTGFTCEGEATEGDATVWRWRRSR